MKNTGFEHKTQTKSQKDRHSALHPWRPTASYVGLSVPRAFKSVGISSFNCTVNHPAWGQGDEYIKQHNLKSVTAIILSYRLLQEFQKAEPVLGRSWSSWKCDGHTKHRSAWQLPMASEFFFPECWQRKMTDGLLYTHTQGNGTNLAPTLKADVG